MTRLIFALLAMFLLTLNLAVAQQASWEIVVYDADAEQVQVIDASGEVAPFSVPRSPEGNLLIPKQISADRTWVAGALLVNNGTSYAPALANLSAGMCCTVLPSEFYANGLFFISFSPFSADNAMIAYSVGGYNEETYAPNPATLTIYDINANAVIQSVPMPEYEFAFMQDFSSWVEQGVTFTYAPSAPSEFFVNDFMQALNPVDGQITQTDIFEPLRGERLALTGELAVGAVRDDLPALPPYVTLPSSNAVQYFAPLQAPLDRNDAPVAGQLIYFNPANLDLYPRWVLDGNAILVQNNDPAYAPAAPDLLMRGGGTMSVPEATGLTFYAGTPDGWLMLRVPQAAINDASLSVPIPVLHFNSNGEAQQIAEISSNSRLLSKPELGATAQRDLGFNTLTWQAPPTTPGATVCLEALDPRLVVGERAWVLPGDANNLRDAPSLRGAEVGQVEGGWVVNVLEGPVCADGYAWWYVTFPYGLEGWTAESGNGEYWLEPLGVPNGIEFFG